MPLTTMMPHVLGPNPRSGSAHSDHTPPAVEPAGTIASIRLRGTVHAESSTFRSHSEEEAVVPAEWEDWAEEEEEEEEEEWWW
jgi:hypothetical protein